MRTHRFLLTLSFGILGWLMATGAAHAEWNATPIAVPLIGTSGAASPYPSTITVAPPSGPTHTGFGAPVVTLLYVTHPCPEDLAVLLVHNHTDKFLLMSHAGGCRPLAGTSVVFNGSAPLPDEETTTAPYTGVLNTGASNYGPAPAFPDPAPAGPYDPHQPPNPTLVAGTWDLYVVDLRGSNRGVIAGGWTLSYGLFGLAPLASPLPVTIPETGKAATYPIIFDFSQAAPEARVHRMDLLLAITHRYADDLRIVLESPIGTKVMVMGNAGGNNPLTGHTLGFNDGYAQHIPDEGPLDPFVVVTYKPGSAYGGAELESLRAPAPPAPYAAEFSVFEGERLQGWWKLWIFDDTSPDGGSVTQAELGINADNPFTLNVTAPITMSTSTQPFVHVTGQASGVDWKYSAVWRVSTGDEFTAAGPMTVRPSGADPFTVLLDADVPLKKGNNVINVSFATDTGGDERNVRVTVNEFTYSLSEGATGGFFDEDVTMGNAGDAAAPVRVDFLQEGALPITHTDTVAANAPLQLHVDDLVPPGAVSTIVHSLDAIPLAVERTMSWDSTGYGGSGGTAISPSTRWLFAEGSQGYFDTYLLLANDNDTDSLAAVRFLLEGGGGVVSRNITVPAHKRVTIYAGDIPELVNRSFGMDVTAPATAQITAERAMYFPHSGARVFEGGHEAAGVNSTSTRWYLAEGATGPFFECFVLLSNPNASVAHTTLTYLLPGSGGTITQSVDVPANGRTTVNIETVDARLLNTAVSTIVSSDVGIIVERSMYWPDISLGWREAHNSPGVIDPALRWGVSDVRAGGPRDYQTYILLANPNPVEAEVEVRLLRSGAAPIVQTYTLPPTSRTNVTAASLSGNVAGTFSAEVQVLNFQPIVVEKAMYWNSGSEVWAAGTGVVATPFPPR